MKKTFIIFVFLTCVMVDGIYAQGRGLESDRRVIEKHIKESFEKWSEKGEFEKQSIYEERLKNQSKDVFIDVCVKQIQDRCKSVGSFGYSRELLKYDSEREFFPVLVVFKDKEFRTQVNVPIGDAPGFKNRGLQNTELFDWCFVGNSLFPRKMKVSGGYVVNLPLNNTSEIMISFNNLEINNPYLAGFVFDYVSMVKAHEIQKEKKRETEVDSQVFAVVEQMPEFSGGQAELFKYLSGNIKYPTIAAENGIEGRVIVTFVVRKDGRLTNVNVSRSLHPDCDKEAVRVIKGMPDWIPGRQNGQVVNVKYTLPVTFKLQK